jgi:hypothetical protein
MPLCTCNTPVFGASASIMGRSFQSALLRPFVLDRNICSFLWYGGVAGIGLRSDGRSPPLIQERQLYPAHRHLRAGATGAPALLLFSQAPTFCGTPNLAAFATMGARRSGGERVRKEE